VLESPLAQLFGFRQRKHPRIRRQFPVSLLNGNLNLPVQGVTSNLSRQGALIRVEDFHLFRPGRLTVVTIFLPPYFTGQDRFIGLQGEATILRIDGANKVIAVEFRKPLKQFEPIGKLGLH
jgi:hypothetical protein